MDQFRDEYRAWLEDALSEGVPASVVAFAFNLFQRSSADNLYGVEFVGASKFDPNDSDWVCEEIWEPAKGRAVDIPSSFCDGDWGTCLHKMRNFIGSLLAESSQLSEKLRSVEGVGIGFVDGELMLFETK